MRAVILAVFEALAVIMATTPADAQVPFLGGCPEKEVVKNFNVSRYLGKWYEQERYFAIFQLGGNCVSATYTDEGDGVVGVDNVQVNLLTKRRTSIKGTAKLAGDGGEAKLNVQFSSVGNFQAPYWILDTDYDNFAIVWSCSGLFGANAQFAWVLTREKNPGLEVLSDIRDALVKEDVPILPFRQTLQVCDN